MKVFIQIHHKGHKVEYSFTGEVWDIFIDSVWFGSRRLLKYTREDVRYILKEI